MKHEDKQRFASNCIDDDDDDDDDDGVFLRDVESLKKTGTSQGASGQLF